MCSFVNTNQLSEFDSIFEEIFDSYCSTGPCAIVNPIREGWLQMNNIVFPLSMAVGILESSVAVILADVPPSWI